MLLQQICPGPEPGSSSCQDNAHSAATDRRPEAEPPPVRVQPIPYSSTTCRCGHALRTPAVRLAGGERIRVGRAGMAIAGRARLVIVADDAAESTEAPGERASRRRGGPSFDLPQAPAAAPAALRSNSARAVGRATPPYLTGLNPEQRRRRGARGPRAGAGRRRDRQNARADDAHRPHLEPGQGVAEPRSPSPSPTRPRARCASA